MIEPAQLDLLCINTIRTLSTDAVQRASSGYPGAPMALSFIGGLGGRDLASEEFFEMAKAARAALKSGVPPPPRLLYTAGELREVRKLQAIAHAEGAGGEQ